MLRWIKQALFGKPGRHRGEHRPIWVPRRTDRVGYRGVMETRPYHYHPEPYQAPVPGSAGSPFLPRCEAVPVPPRLYADAATTQVLPVVPTEPEPLTPGRDLMTGEPRMFGVPLLAALHGLRMAVPVMGTVVFSPV